MRSLLIRVGPVVLRVERRAMIVSGLLVVAVLVAGAAMLTTGSYPISAWQAVQSLWGANPDPLGAWFVTDQRAPRAVAALGVGAALGVSGALLQQVSRNPLGSPDIIGFTVGSATGALIAILLLGTGPLGVGIGAMAGGVATAVAVWLLVGGALTAHRLVLVGIGVALMLHAVNSLLMVRAELARAQTASQWLAGSLNGVTWDKVVILGAGLAALGMTSLAASRWLAVMALGDDLAAGLGVPVRSATTRLVFLAVGLAALATAIAGPVAFVALAAPQLARRLTRTSVAGLGPAALMGGLLVMVSDLAGARLFAPTQLPVGVVTGAVGGVYLIGLLSVEWRRR